MKRTIDIRGRRKGTALILTVVVLVIAIGITALTMEQSRVSVQHAATVARHGQARAAAEAGISYVCQQIAKPTLALPTAATDYTGSTNNWIAQTSVKPPSTGEWRPVTATVAGTFDRLHPTIWVPGDARFPNIPVFCWIKDTGAGNFEISSYAELRAGSTVEESEQIALDLRESVGFSTYMFFSFNANLVFGGATVNGSVHSNAKIQFAGNPDKTYVYGNATAHTGFTNNANGIVSGIKNGAAPQVQRPSGAGNRLLDRATTAEGLANPTNGVAGGGAPALSSGSGFWHFQKRAGSVWAGLGGGGDVKTTIVINSNTGKLDITVQGLSSNGTGQGSATGPTYTYTGVDFPPAGTAVLFSDGPVTVKSVDGTFRGDLTIVSSKSSGTTDPSGNDGHTITVDSNLRYVDQDGDPAYVLKDSTNTTVTNPDPNASWGASGLNLQYASNAGTNSGEYNPSSANKLGLMANGSIQISNAPSPAGVTGSDPNLIIDANTYSHNGSPLDATAQSTGAKGNLVFSGSQVGYTSAVRYDLTPHGYTKGGLYSFNDASATNPPSAWLSSGQAAFGAIRRVSQFASPAKYLSNGTNMTSGSGSLYGGYGGP